MKLFWWNLNAREKAKRSFILAPFGLLALLLPEDARFIFFDRWGLAAVSILLIIIQGFYYKHKAANENHLDSQR